MLTDNTVLTAFRGKSILIVDDEKFSRNLLSRMLQPLTIVEAVDGAQGLHMFQADPSIALVLCDFNMPIMDGLKMLKSIRAGADKTRHTTPVLMLTGSSDSALVRLALGLDVDGFLVKPVSLKTLEGRLKHVLSNKRDLKPMPHYAKIEVEEISQRLLRTMSQATAGKGASDTRNGGNGEISSAEGRRFLLDKVPAQAVLAADIRTPAGDVLVTAGTPLNERLVSRLMDLRPSGMVPEHVWIVPESAQCGARA